LPKEKLDSLFELLRGYDKTLSELQIPFSPSVEEQKEIAALREKIRKLLATHAKAAEEKE